MAAYQQLAHKELFALQTLDSVPVDIIATDFQQERRTAIPWYLNGCLLTKALIFGVIFSWTLVVIYQVIRVSS
ncbi:11575_t:CDS:2 [Paraglomus brasilianum]|uniref:11575_t:CDS:1 n=1 Tax=Paraglomus brasilianum TaxID=144538 RepID=A0A9N9CY57_9GLOM|nr:11575_t:CDS:2 [Paraglomus brasilianum]